MSETDSGFAQNSPAAPLSATVLRVAWLSILLGLAIEGLLLAVAAGYGVLGSLKPFAADLAQKISWSVIVCVGIAFGTVAARARTAAMGLLGLFAAPSGFYLARALHKGAAQALALPDVAAMVAPSVLVLALIKAAEYGVLGMAVGWVGQRQRAGLWTHVLLGLAVGAAFGGLTIYLVIAAAPQQPGAAALAARTINEVIFPIGCALVLYAAQSMGRRMGA
ncbi:MAG: hypothetical protein HY942_02830 [Gammaproteobacteria bacterium]|nr:hypothetical protein [Gammaproteobacteria bacterium]